MKKLLKRALAGAGLQISRTGQALVIPRPEPGPATYGGAGLDWNAAAVDAFLAGPLRRFVPECVSLPGYDPDNPFFGFADAAVAYAFVRERRPPVVVEVGSGNSSRVIRAALDRNGAGRLLSIDPEPRTAVAGVCHEHRAEPVQKVPVEWFRDLPAGALLFIDSSHRAGTGSDVNHLFLEVLPSLRPGVLVHVHDIYLPDDYPVEWNVDRGFLYSEQYLLHALLCFSSGFRILWPGRWVLDHRRDELARVLGEREDLGRHCSFWLERVEESRSLP
jgi:hypothetical protein